MSTETLTSLAMLKVRIDAGGDYLEYLRPFVLQVLADHEPEQVSERIVSDFLRSDFGLEIPGRAVQLVLQRLARAGVLQRDHGVFRVLSGVPTPGLGAKKAEAQRHISAIVEGLLSFSPATNPLETYEQAVDALVQFLSEFNVPFLRAYLRGTAIPDVPNKQTSLNVLVSQYVLELHKRDPERFSSFMVLLQGHMLANALLCPDLQHAPRTYKAVTFFLDTPLLVRRLGLEGDAKRAAVTELIKLVKQLGGRIAAFSHSVEELDRVVRGAAEHIDSHSARGEIVLHARASGRTRSDLQLLAAKVPEELEQAGIEVQPTPRYVTKLQIDETAFAEVLDDEISYLNPRARDYDINSVRSVYVLRANTAPRELERARAALVTSNSSLARAAFTYGQQHEASKEVSSVVTDFSLANMAWLKAPMGAPSLPTTELLAFAYAALQPSEQLLTRFLKEIDRLERQGKISARDHQLLRSSTVAQEELMRLTLGQEQALTEETVSETLARVTDEIQREERELREQESTAHQRTKQSRDEAEQARRALVQKIYWRLRRRASWFAWVASTIWMMLVVLGALAGLGASSGTPLWGALLLYGSIAVAILTVVTWVQGTTAVQLHAWIERRFLTLLLRRESRLLGADIEAERTGDR